MLEALFSVDMPFAARLAIALVIVIGLIGAAAWMVRRFGTPRLAATSARGRQPHLDVIETANVDGRRRLVLIQRYGTEHLMMIGGPTDVVIETNIMREATPREAQAPRPPAPGEVLTRSLSLARDPPGRPRLHGPIPARPEPAPRPSDQVMRAEPPRRPQPGLVASPPAQGEPPMDEALAQLAGILGLTPQRDTSASDPRARRREQPPLPAQREPRVLQSQSTPPSPAAPRPTHSPAAAPTPESRAERSSTSTQSPSSD